MTPGVLIVWDEDRPAALRTLRHWLDGLWIEGLVTTAPFHRWLVDQQPVIVAVEIRGGGRAARVVDALSPIRSAEISVDAGAWKPVSTADGLLDGRAEILEVEAPPDAELVLLRVMDAAFNTATFRLSEEG